MSKIAEKIVLLLNKAEGTDNQAEQEAYSAKAEALMIAHGLERSMLAGMAGQDKRDEITTATMEFPGGYRKSHTLAAYTIIKALGLDGYKAENAPLSSDPYKTCTRLYIVGPSRDLDDAKILVASLLLQATAARKAWWPIDGRTVKAMSGLSTQAVCDQFVEGYARGAATRIAAQRATAVTEWESDHGAGTVAVVQDRTRRDIQDYMAAQGLRSSRSRGRRAAHGAGSAGTAAGRNADVGARRVTGRRALA